MTRAPAAPTEPWRSLVEKYFPAEQVNNAIAILTCESGGSPMAHNYSDATADDSWGLFQINRYGRLAAGRPSPEWLAVAENNIAYSAGMHRDQGWAPWGCATKLGIR